jgi:tripartite ATP-independent transporter DctP family solute receptor
MNKPLSKLLPFLVAALLFGCGEKKSDTAAEAPKAETVKLTVAHVLSDTHPEHAGLVGLAKELKEKTNGSVELNIISGGALGNENDEINQVTTGALDMALIQGISIFQGLDSRLAVEEVPFLFQNREEAYRAVDGAYGNKVSEILKEKGIHVIAYWENGFRHFTNNKRAIVTPQDLAGIKFRSAPSEIRLQMFKELGASAIPMAFTELFTGLQQGTVDGQENPLSIISSSKFNEVQKYLSLSGHIWNSSVLIISSGVWDKLNADQKKIMQELSFKYRDSVRKEIAAQDAKIAEELKIKGMQVNDVDKSAFQAAVKNVVKIYADKNGDELLRLID